MHPVYSFYIFPAFQPSVIPLSIPVHSPTRGIESDSQISVWCGQAIDVFAQWRVAAAQTADRAVYVKQKVRELSTRYRL